ncbi:MAG TPA: ABC transporter substrate-binding protein, partial [bacterium]|nr:ABC transporter substrate-binding protein [bacterium]
MNESASHRRDALSRRKFLAGGLALGGGLAGLDLLGPSSAVAPAWAASTGTPKKGGTLIAAQEVDPVSLDPHTDANFSSLQGFEHIYESLTGYDEKTNIVPALAEKWEITNGSKTYTFHLRANVKFHNGQTMTADDVKYSIERVLDPKTASGWRSWVESIKEIKVIDPLTVQMNLDAPY